MPAVISAPPSMALYEAIIADIATKEMARRQIRCRLDHLFDRAAPPRCPRQVRSWRFALPSGSGPPRPASAVQRAPPETSVWTRPTCRPGCVCTSWCADLAFRGRAGGSAGVWVVPLLGWYHASFDVEPDITGWDGIPVPSALSQPPLPSRGSLRCPRPHRLSLPAGHRRGDDGLQRVQVAREPGCALPPPGTPTQHATPESLCTSRGADLGFRGGSGAGGKQAGISPLLAEHLDRMNDPEGKRGEGLGCGAAAGGPRARPLALACPAACPAGSCLSRCLSRCLSQRVGPTALAAAVLSLCRPLADRRPRRPPHNRLWCTCIRGGSNIPIAYSCSRGSP